MELIFFHGRHCLWLLDGRLSIGKRALSVKTPDLDFHNIRSEKTL